MLKMFCGLVALVCVGVGRAETVTLGTLLNEMIDPERLTRLAPQPYRLMHASSYDRLTVQPNTPEWFANTDWSQWQRVETVEGRTEYVLLDAEGPGAIVRFWTTIMGSGNTLRIYLDGSGMPAVQGTLTEIVGRQGWIDSPLSFVAPAIAGTGVGHNLYLPIPFGKRCKITVESPSWRLYYNIDYRLYDPGTMVETFPTNALSLYRAEHAAASDALSAGHPSCVHTTVCDRIQGRLSWGGQMRSVTLSGPAAIRRLRVKLAAPDLAQALRSTHLEVDFDGECGSIKVPVGDFFCTGYTVTNGCTWMTEVSADGNMEAYWVMPFGERATVRLVNHGFQNVDVESCEVWSGPYVWEESSLHFHAAWREYPFEDSVSWKGKDLNYVTLEGAGRLAGDTLAVFNDASSVPHPYANWWGEGDEKIYIDGEKFPSHIGTGTEDYYGYAWCLPQTFNTPFIAQPIGAGNDKAGNTVNTRLRLLDDIPYRTGIRFDMELLSQRTGRHCFAPAVFWYARPGGKCHAPDPVAKSQLPIPRATSGMESAPVICPVGMRKNVEEMAVLKNTAGPVSCVTSNGLGLSDETCVVWPHCVLGSRIDFALPASFTGECALTARVLAGPASGALRVMLNGQVMAENVGLFASVAEPRVLSLGTQLLNQGENMLSFEVVCLPVGQAEGMFAFDCLENQGPYYVQRFLPIVRERWEAERLPVEVTLGQVAEETNTWGASCGRCVLWHDAQPGGTSVFSVVSDETRCLPLTGVFIASTNGGICDVSLNGKRICQMLDLQGLSNEVVRQDFGVQILEKGVNEIRLSVVGAEEGKDLGRLSVGIDCFDVGSLYGSEMQAQGVSPMIGPYEDADGDGLFNLAEYAFGGNPSLKDGVELWPSPMMLQGDGLIIPIISYRRRKPASTFPLRGTEGVDTLVDGVRFRVETCEALGKNACWATTNRFGPVVLAISSPDDDNGKTVRVRVRPLAPLGGGHSAARFLRVNLSEP